MNLLNEFKRHLLEGRFFDNQNRLLVAVSTGVDSMTLIDLLQQLPANRRPFMMVAHVNHHLRQQSKVEEQFLRQYCDQHHLPLAIYQWLPDQHPQSGIETAARNVRYAFFARLMAENRLDTLVTAHHGDDLAETMLMKLTRGGQLNQLVGIADQRPFHGGRLVRPLLSFSKVDLAAYARQRGLQWYEDETNGDLSIQRNRYRHQIIPLLKKENPQLLRHLYQYHQELASAVDVNSKLIQEQLTELLLPNGDLAVDRLLNYSSQLQTEILRQWLEQVGIRDLKATQLRELVDSLANPQNAHLQVALPHHYQLIKDYSQLFVQKGNENIKQQQFIPDTVVKFGHWYSLNSDRQLAIAKTRDFFSPDSDQLMEMWFPKEGLPLHLRTWKTGDQLRLKGGLHQEVRRVLIDHKVPVDQRPQQMVLTLANGQVLAVMGYKWSWLDRPTNYRQQWVHCYVGWRHQEGEKYE